MNNQVPEKPVLVVDDEPDIRDLMEMTLVKMGLSVETADGVQAACRLLLSKKYSLVLTDMRMPDGSGMDVLDFITERNLDIPVAVITAFGNADHAVLALKRGAFDYLQKPITLAQLRSLVRSAVKVGDEEKKPVRTVDPSPVAQPAPKAVVRDETPAPKPATDNPVPRLMGTSPLIDEVRKLIVKLARTNVPVYISGESGSGKEQAARSIHELSARKNAPFVAVNCGAIPENLMESEFFGYKKGSFTGADADREGFFQHADGGTLFLDEVADLPLAMQVKLLRAIQEKAVRRIGDAQEKPVDVRIISATHKDLAAQVAIGDFRQDLFYRLNVVGLAMPPLREMREDLPQLVSLLLRKHCIDGEVVLSDEARKALLQYSYPGNFRELENILERAVALAQDNIIRVGDLQINTHEYAADGMPSGAGSALSVEGQFVLGESQLQEYLDAVEGQILMMALENTRFNRTQAAKLLGISFRSMRYRMERLGIE